MSELIEYLKGLSRNAPKLRKYVPKEDREAREYNVANSVYGGE